jgi:hypothetical protein
MTAFTAFLAALPEILWGLLLSLYYAVYNLCVWIKPDNFSKSIAGDIVLVNFRVLTTKFCRTLGCPCVFIV